MYVKEKDICPAYISNINLNWEKPIILLVIPNRGKKGMTLSCSKKISALLHGITSKHIGNFYCLDFLHSFIV